MVSQRVKQQRLTFLIIQSLMFGIFYLLISYLGNILCYEDMGQATFYKLALAKHGYSF